MAEPAISRNGQIGEQISIPLLWETFHIPRPVEYWTIYWPPHHQHVISRVGRIRWADQHSSALRNFPETDQINWSNIQTSTGFPTISPFNSWFNNLVWRVQAQIQLSIQQQRDVAVRGAILQIRRKGEQTSILLLSWQSSIRKSTGLPTTIWLSMPYHAAGAWVSRPAFYSERLFWHTDQMNWSNTRKSIGLHTNNVPYHRSGALVSR